MVSNSILRANARKQLGGSVFANSWVMLLVAYLIASAIASIASFISLFIMGAIYYGMARIAVRRACNDGEVDLSDLFKGFSENFIGAMILGIMQSIFIALWSCLFIIPGIVKSCSYSMSFYIMQENPSKSWSICLNESRAMMNGHKMQYFLLNLSFIGWFIVGSMLCGVGILFVFPYMYMAQANFYLALKASKGGNSRNGSAGGANGSRSFGGAPFTPDNGANGGNNGYNAYNGNGGDPYGSAGYGAPSADEPFAEDKNGSDDTPTNNNNKLF